MGRGFTQECTFELILREKGVSEKDIGWILSKLDSHEYVLEDCHYITRILSKESDTHAKEIFINRYFALNIKGHNRENKIHDFFQECIDKKKIWTLLEKNLGAICIQLPDSSLNGEIYFFIFGPNKKCPEPVYGDSYPFFSSPEIKQPTQQNPLDRSSLRLAG